MADGQAVREDGAEPRIRSSAEEIAEFPSPAPSENSRQSYALLHLPGHLANASRRHELRRLLTDFAFLDAKQRTHGVESLIEDYGLNSDPDLSEVQQALRLSARQLSDDPSQLWPQLCGRLMGSSLESLRRRLRPPSPREWLLPLHPSLEQTASTLERTIKIGAQSELEYMAVSSDGTQILIGSADHTLELWDSDTGTQKSLLKGEGACAALAMAPDGSLAMSFSQDGLGHLWDLGSAKLLQTFNVPEPGISAVALGLSTSLAILGFSSGRIELRALACPEQLQQSVDAGGAVTGLLTSSAHRFVSVAGGKLKVWELPGGRLLASLRHHKKHLYTVDLSPDGRWALSGGFDGSLRLWDLENAREVSRIEEKGKRVWRAALSQDAGRAAVAWSHNRVIEIWDLETSRLIESVEGHSEMVQALRWGSDGFRLYSAARDQTVKLWWFQPPAEPQTPRRSGADAVWSLDITADGLRALSVTLSGEASLWDVASGLELSRLKLGDATSCWSAALAPDGKRFVVALAHGRIEVWSFETKSRLLDLPGHTNWVFSVALAPEKRQIASACLDGNLRLWDLDTGNQITWIEADTQGMRRVCIAADGSRAVANSLDGRIWVWDLEGTSSLRALGGLRSTRDGDLALSRDGSTLAFPTETGFALVDLASEAMKHEINETSEPIRRLVLSGRGERLATVYASGLIEVRDLESQTQFLTFSGDSAVDSCSATPGFEVIAIGEASGKIHFLAARETLPRL